ncbi:MAG TPA: hypothetical protein DEA96_12180 [Leptospiraceae bacterium]|nr:hypothetical protein [Spirochaetaceae bacterium]HBS05718.1 hypothetical protein [Leptospiraceae bacterium]|tara:strand:- start:19830 stop:20150 length:321 start_codon:yes stop_codon:yes gene_type:complete
MLASSAFAETNPVTDEDRDSEVEQKKQEMKEAMAETMEAMVPAMKAMMKAMLEAQIELAREPETARSMAAFKRNLYESLIKEGFSEEEALQITISTSLPSAGYSGN